MKNLVYIFILFTCFFNSIEAQVNESIKNELIKINNDDQNLRKIYFVKDEFDKKVDSISKINNIKKEDVKEFISLKIKELDSINLIMIENIINIYGYPGTDLVGSRENNVAWSVIQHSNYKTRKKYIRILKEAAENNQLAFSAYATTLDRVLMEENLPQIYGSQVKNVILKEDNKK